MVKISVSILSSDFANMGQEISSLTEAGADAIHFDVMDGNFVPNITIGADFIKAARKYSPLPFETHLMVADPEKHIKAFAEAGSDYIIIHQEAVTHLDRVINQIHSEGKKAGVSISPATHESVLQYIIDKVDLILIMTVNPGFGGQEFLHSQLSKIANINNMIKAAYSRNTQDIRPFSKLAHERQTQGAYKAQNLSVLDVHEDSSIVSPQQLSTGVELGKRSVILSVDGGITAEIAPIVVRAGANSLVAGNAIFSSQDYKRTIELLRK